jgi:hypothetical protein
MLLGMMPSDQGPALVAQAHRDDLLRLAEHERLLRRLRRAARPAAPAAHRDRRPAGLARPVAQLAAAARGLRRVVAV